MDRITAITLCVMLAFVSVGCGRQNINLNNPDTKGSWHLCELQEDQEKEPIENAIPYGKRISNFIHLM